MAKNTSGGLFVYKAVLSDGNYTKMLYFTIIDPFLSSSKGLIQTLWPIEKLLTDLSELSGLVSVKFLAPTESVISLQLG